VTGENPKADRKTCHSDGLSTINTIWTNPGVNLGLCGDRPTTNSLTMAQAKRPLIDNEVEIHLHYINSTNGRI
jgi:hypothetical protein